ncbi:protein of unknown function, might belong to Glutathione-regulated potassium-efflux system protein KefC [Shewanella benthica]|uniref:RCK N-terminal domain-containing protein n=1 Tax=Shewanella benthica TaxID=43661 RepID=A0A330M703_9GAMM|nr:hypothetical protein [Shewanella benthica]SQH77745.1 protein of unknown function, might belong to Glutathione-regulated potassium-efflux system protein KefC [Shewanella benthica]
MPRYEKSENKPEADEFTKRGTVIIAGIGRFGQMVNHFLVTNNIKTVVLDQSVDQVAD